MEQVECLFASGFVIVLVNLVYRIWLTTTTKHLCFGDGIVNNTNIYLLHACCSFETIGYGPFRK